MEFWEFIEAYCVQDTIEYKNTQIDLEDCKYIYCDMVVKSFQDFISNSDKEKINIDLANKVANNAIRLIKNCNDYGHFIYAKKIILMCESFFFFILDKDLENEFDGKLKKLLDAL